MPSHFTSIGFAVEDRAAFDAIVQDAAEAASPVRTKRGSYLRWSSGVGAELWMQMDRRGDIIGAHPHFVGTAAMRVAVTHTVKRSSHTALDGAFHAWANPATDAPDSGEFPFVFDAPDFYLHAPQLTMPVQATVQLAAFAEEVTVFPTVEAYQASGSQFAVESFIPSGLFGPSEGATDAPTAHGVFTGRVLDAGTRENPLSRRPFLWAAVKTLGGTVDVVVDPAVAPDGLPVGGVVQGLFWMSGSLSGYPKRKGLRLVSRLLGR